MRFFSIVFALCAALVAADSNPITSPLGGSIQAGTTTTITWNPTSPGATITLLLRTGSSTNLAPGTTIASGIPNSGSYSWSVPTGVTSGSYTIEIKDSTGGDNFSPMFQVTGGTGSSAASVSTIPTSTKTSSGTTSSTTSHSSSSTSSSSSSSPSSSSKTSSSTASAKSNAPSSAAGLARTGAGSVAAVVGLGALVIFA